MTHSPSPIPARLAALRQALVRHDLAAVLVPSSDPHLSEYLPERWQGRVWLSGFTGSMGTLVVLLVWLYYAAVVFFVGAMITAVIDERWRFSDVRRRLEERAARRHGPAPL